MAFVPFASGFGRQKTGEEGRIFSDHTLFIGRHDDGDRLPRPRDDAALAAEDGGIGFLVKIEAEGGQALQRLGPDVGGVLADATGEGDGIEARQRRPSSAPM